MGFFVIQKNLVAMIPKQLTIDLNADLGEYQTENQYFLECQILNHISTCNIACGGHTGNEESMKKIIIACKEKGVAIGAHPSYPDPEGFGRRKMKIDESTLKKSLIDQVCSFLNVSEALNVPASHVKPHGRLYNDAASNSNLAYLLISVVNEINPDLSIVGPPNSILADVAKKSGSSFVGEAFLDRRYKDDGSLVNRGHSGAVLETITERCEQAESIVCNWTVKTESERFIDIQAETLCLHGDSSDALKTAQMVRLLFESKNIEIKSFAA
jgi:UPF0271 protein